MTYVYIIEDFAYSDFEYWVLTHDKHYTKSEFKAILREAISKVKGNNWFFHNDLIKLLKEEYGFKSGDIVPVVHIDDLEREEDD